MPGTTLATRLEASFVVESGILRNKTVQEKFQMTINELEIETQVLKNRVDISQRKLRELRLLIQQEENLLIGSQKLLSDKNEELRIAKARAGL